MPGLEAFNRGQSHAVYVHELKHDGLAIPGTVVLAHEPPFPLGSATVAPATRQIARGGISETIEPRVMQALVALARAKGEVVTRDELIDRCWNGRIVSDDAINRVLSRIRAVAAGIGGGGFSIETIPRVGYRLLLATASSDASASTSAPVPEAGTTDRRRVLAGAGAVALAVAGGALLWHRPWRHRPLPEAETFYRRGVLLSREALPGQVRQFVAYFERAVAIDPEYGEAWGALALSYSHLLEGYDRAELASLPGRIRAAAARALELDPGNADAELGLIFITPFFRNWRTKEVALRRIVARHPRHWLAHGRLAVLLYQVGRLAEGIAHHREAINIEPVIPVAYHYLIRNLSALGKAQEAETLIEQARQRWPAHPALWMAKFDHLLFSGRPKSAAAFAMDPDARPVGWSDASVASALRLARAMDTRDTADIAASIQEMRDMAVADVRGIPGAVPGFAALGRADLAFAALDRYFFNRGGFGPSSPIAPFTRRYTDLLFGPAFSGLRGEKRFAALLHDVGLEAYWKETSTVPDYRRG